MHSDSWHQYEKLLPLVEKPGRYLGTEHGAVHKDPSGIKLHVALAFPEVYEIAQSHLGLQLLYRLLNKQPEIYAERVYAPWPDMEQQLRAHSLPLASLETATPLRHFHIVGFSLQYELTYTNLLAMLELGDIPLRSAERTTRDPLVIAGGPCAFNPEPVAPFIDAVLIGDGEQAILEICHTCLQHKGRSRGELLENLAKLGGVYVPSLYRAVPQGRLAFHCRKPTGPAPGTVQKRIVADLEAARPEPLQIVPVLRTVHDRANVEVMRGCVKGCRFCQAGYVYRPLRERDPRTLLEEATRLIQNTGYDEISLLSLSTGDYSCLDPLLTALVDGMNRDRVATSLPSTRVDALSPQMIQQIQRVRKTGFTLAPEAGTERLRRVIQKAYTEDQLTDAAAHLFDLGWRNLKLYFMIGLPTESDEDLEGIVRLCRKLKRIGARRAGVTASASTFVPKPHTPFQWMEQISPQETARRQAYLSHALRKIGVRFKWHDPAQSYLEGIIARADGRVADAIERAFRLGCRFDGWTEQLRPDLWQRAFAETGIDPEIYLGARPLEDPLPWEHIDSGVSKKFLRRDLEAALREAAIPDCARERCTACGVCDFRAVRNIVYSSSAAKGCECRGGEARLTALADAEHATLAPAPARARMPALEGASELRRFRLRHLKVGWARFLGSLDLVAGFLRAMRRARLPLAFTAGYHPAPRVSPGPALALGVESLCEMVDIWLTTMIDPKDLLRALNRELPPEFRVTEVFPLSLPAPSINAEIGSFVYEADLRSIPEDKLGNRFIERRLAVFSEADSWPIDKTVKGNRRKLDARTMATVSLSAPRRLVIETALNRAGAIKPIELLRSIFDLDAGLLAQARLTKVDTRMLSGSPPSGFIRTSAFA